MAQSLIAQAKTILQEDADTRLITIINRLVTDGKAEWVEDPQVDGVVGVLRKGTNTALVVIYVTDRDFEVADEIMELR